MGMRYKNACYLATLVHAKNRCSLEQSITPMGHNSLLDPLKWDLIIRDTDARYIITNSSDWSISVGYIGA